MAEILTVAETGSTNSDLLTLARGGAPEGAWLRAERQTGGRGRQGRAWHSPPGNLYASTLVRLSAGDPPAPTLALVAGVALHETASLFRHATESQGSITPPSTGPRGPEFLNPGLRRDDDLMLKWPNDLLAGPAKLAGILLERADDAVVIGFGVNLAHHPIGLDRPVTNLAALAGAAPDAAVFLETLAESFARRLAEWRRAGLAPIRRHWLAAAHPPGTALATPAGDGLFDGLDEAGALRLRLADGTTQVIHAGDVFLI
jgi:BirA family biotin operon repressor/biotin-[acetyl-CoA-carboxylase] ligase